MGHCPVLPIDPGRKCALPPCVAGVGSVVGAPVDTILPTSAYRERMRLQVREGAKWKDRGNFGGDTGQRF